MNSASDAIQENVSSSQYSINAETQEVDVAPDQFGTLSQLLLNNRRSKLWPQYAATLSVTIGTFAMGTLLGWTSPAGDELMDKSSFFHFSNSQMSWIGAFMAIGAAAVVVPIGFLTDKFGRKNLLLFLTLPFLIGWSLIIWAKSAEMFCIGRFITGMAGGAFTVIVPIYIGEIAENRVRGKLGGYLQLMVTLGVLFVYVLGREVKLFWLSLACGMVPIVFFATFVFMPESPLYHLQRGREQCAKESLQWLRGSQCDIEQELFQLRASLESNSHRHVASGSKKAIIKAFIVAFGLMFIQQLSGINAIIFYTSMIFKAAGSTLDPSLATIIVGAVQVIATFVSTLVVDRLGCRILLILSGSVMSICTYILGVFFHLQERNGSEYVSNLGWLPLLSVCIYIIVFSLGFGPIPWAMVGVLFPPQIKGLGTSITCFFNWVLVFFITKFFSDLNDEFGNATTFWIFSVFTALGTAFVFFYVPEIKGKSLDTVQSELSGCS